MVNFPAICVYAKRSAVILLATSCLVSTGWAQDSGDAAAENYARLLQEIADLKLSIAHKEVYIESQKQKIDSLNTQIEQTQGLIDSIDPMLAKMTEAISNEIDSDIPFNSEERFNRLGALQDILGDQEAKPADKMRRALSIYDAEVNYGQTLAAYRGDHPTTPGGRLTACRENAESGACALTKSQQEKMIEGASIDDLAGELKDGTYLRYGRLALAWSAADDSEVLRYDPTSKEWARVGGSQALDVRRAVKIALGEAAPGVVEAPVYIAN